MTLFRTGERREEDRNTKWMLVGSVTAGIGLGLLAAVQLPGLEFPITGWAPTLIGIAIMWAGIGLRAWAIVALGRFFRRDIQVAQDQLVVRAGPYAAVRHPAYAGNLLMLAGLGVALANWASLAALVVIPVAGHLPRIRVEDAAPDRPARRPLPRLRSDHSPAGAGSLVVDSRRWEPAQ